MSPNIKTAFNAEMIAAKSAYADRDFQTAFAKLERAHILGQRYFVKHGVTHWWMLKVGLKMQDWREVFGQITRLFAVIPGYAFGWIPKGNTGGANVSPLKPMPIPEDLSTMLEGYNVWRDVRKRAITWLLILALVSMIIVVGLDVILASGQKEIDASWNPNANGQVQSFGTTSKLSVTPLVNWNAVSEEYQTEAGVSYLIETDKHRILFDLGFNQHQTNPSPLEHNMKTLGVSLESIDSIFISHAHRDHIGGVAQENTNSFSVGTEQINLSGKAIFAPNYITYPGAQITNVDRPTALLEGVASTGPIARQLYIGKISEQAMVIDLEGEGLVVIVGCGHQTLRKLLERIEAVFDQPIYAIIGDLHVPVPKGRLQMFGIDAQRLLASGNGIFDPLTMTDIDAFESQLDGAAERFILGGHDTSDYVLDRLEEKFGSRFQQAFVGKKVVIR